MATKEQQEINQRVEQQINSILADIRSQKSIPGPVGPVGPAGPAGVPGGTYNFQGSFRNLGRLDMVLDRTVDQQGTGNSRSFLNVPEQSTNQMWSLQQGGMMRNHWGQCLSAKKNPEGSDSPYSTFMDECNETDQNQKWTYDNIGRMQWRGGEDTCLSYQELDSAPSGTTNMISKGFPMENQPKGKFFIVDIASCGGTDVSSGQVRPKKFTEKLQWFWG